ncbi:hypothetical protein BDW72DRAFT_184241 [Aspergillus terricola var. indicus]
MRFLPDFSFINTGLILLQVVARYWLLGPDCSGFRIHTSCCNCQYCCSVLSLVESTLAR